MVVCLSLSSCASVGGPALQSEINGLVASGGAQAAAEKITAKSADYGTGNYILYHLDRALVLQLTGDLASSADSLEKAKSRYDELYTRSVTKEAATWLVNDNAAPYRSPAYERVLMNVFQAFNYLQMNNLPEALVEARDLDSKFPVVPDVYAQDKHIFEDNGFARLLCGILYEAAGTGDDLHDALIAYKQALTVYDAYYGGGYVPRILREGLIRLSQRLHDPDLGAYRSRFSGARGGISQPDAATVYVFGSVGFSPVKISQMIPIPLEDGIVAKIAFPEFVRRPYEVRSLRLVLQAAEGTTSTVDTEISADIEDLAQKDLETRRALVMAKALARPAIKYLIERNQKDSIEKKYGPLAGDLFGLASSIYNFYTERADVRSWQALPAQIQAARIQVPAGSYHVNVQELNGAGSVSVIEDKGGMEFKAGQTYFFVRRSLK